MNNTTGLYNSSFGHKALTSNIAGTANSSFGYLALASNSYGYLTISSPVVYNVKFAFKVRYFTSNYLLGKYLVKIQMKIIKYEYMQ